MERKREVRVGGEGHRGREEERERARVREREKKTEREQGRERGGDREKTNPCASQVIPVVSASIIITWYCCS